MRPMSAHLLHHAFSSPLVRALSQAALDLACREQEMRPTPLRYPKLAVEAEQYLAFWREAAR